MLDGVEVFEHIVAPHRGFRRCLRARPEAPRSGLEGRASSARTLRGSPGAAGPLRPSYCAAACFLSASLRNLEHPVDPVGRKPDQPAIGMAELEDEKDRDPDGDRAGEMGHHAHRVGRRNQAVAEKKRGGPSDHDRQNMGRKRTGELARHQHLRVGELSHLIPRRDQKPLLGFGLRFQAVEKPALAQEDRPHLLEGERLGPELRSRRRSGPLNAEAPQASPRGPAPPRVRKVRARDRPRRPSGPSEKASSRWVVNTEKAVNTSRPRTSASRRVTRPVIAPTEPLEAVSTSAGTIHCSAMPTRLAPKVISATKIARLKECIRPRRLNACHFCMRAASRTSCGAGVRFFVEPRSPSIA